MHLKLFKDTLLQRKVAILLRYYPQSAPCLFPAAFQR